MSLVTSLPPETEISASDEWPHIKPFTYIANSTLDPRQDPFRHGGTKDPATQAGIILGHTFTLSFSFQLDPVDFILHSLARSTTRRVQRFVEAL